MYYITKLKWLNEQQNLVMLISECIFKTYKKYIEIYDYIQYTDKCGSSGPHYPVISLDKNITKEQFLNVLCKQSPDIKRL